MEPYLYKVNVSYPTPTGRMVMSMAPLPFTSSPRAVREAGAEVEEPSQGPLGPLASPTDAISALLHLIFKLLLSGLDGALKTSQSNALPHMDRKPCAGG